MRGMSGARSGVLLSVVLLLGCRDVVPEQHFRGVYTEGFEVSEFIPCGGGRDAWLYDEEGQLRAAESLIAHQRSQRVRAYPRVYVDFYGVDEGKGLEGFPADYDRVIRVTRLNLTQESLPSECVIPPDS
ncbi:short-chain dehydrogenase [Edwardsiella tarda]|uniref:short-chain dehydrogenase n=1 Tax=Edwardsiella tarda TaxID=636 RepID=UPI00351BF2AB